MPNKLIMRRRFNKSVQFEALVAKRPTCIEQFVQCRCLAVETLPMCQGKLDGLRVGNIIFYGKFKQDAQMNIYHNCNKKEGIWRLCEKIPREV